MVRLPPVCRMAHLNLLDLSATINADMSREHKYARQELFHHHHADCRRARSGSSELQVLINSDSV